MRSIPMAMTWELLTRGRWHLFLGLLGANLLPVLLLTALRIDGALDPTEPGFVTMQVVLVQLHIFTFGAALLAVHEFAPRHYTMPVASSTLVTWRLLPAMLLMALEQIFSTFLLNVIYGLNWPIWGPALLAAISLAMVLAALWFSEKSPSQPLYIIIAGTVIGLWYKSRCGPMFSQPTRVWSGVTPGDVLTLCGFGLVAYFVSVAGISRSRRGDELGSPGFLNWLKLGTNCPVEVPLRQRSAFRSTDEAQFWYEWRKKGWILPTIVVLTISVSLAMWLMFSRDPVALLEGLVAGGAILSAGGMLGGLVVGNCGSREADLDMGQFQATRPLADRDLARTLLQVTLLTVAISWGIWMATFAITTGITLMVSHDAASRVMQKLQWWYAPASLMGCWIVVATSACMALTGRATFWAKFWGALLPTGMIVAMLAKLLDREMQVWLYSALLVVAGIAIAGLAIWTIIVARRRMLIDSGVVASAALIWIGLIAIVIFESLRHAHGQVSLAIFVAGIAAWVVAPLSATPLALALNRHR